MRGQDERADEHWSVRLLHEPLLHFALLGGLLFGLHQLLAARVAPQPRIAIDAQKHAELVALFEQRQQRVPSQDESDALVRGWLEDEVLLREADRLDLAHQDPALRDQLIARMRALLQASSAPPPPDERALRAYHAASLLHYREPAAITFREYFVSKGSGAEDRARNLLQRLRLGELVAEQAVLHNARSEGEIASLYGDELVSKLRSAPLESWHIVRSARGLHVVKVTALLAARDPSFSELRARLTADVAAEQEREQFQAHLRDLIARWQAPEQP